MQGAGGNMEPDKGLEAFADACEAGNHAGQSGGSAEVPRVCFSTIVCFPAGTAETGSWHASVLLRMLTP